MATPAALSRAELEQALGGQVAEHLQERARRLEKSQAGMAEVLALEEAERSLLAQETQELNATIDLMMKELRKLNIGATNIVDPRLDEGPLAFIGRYWDQVKPRDTAFQTSEHVGEIKKPIITEGTGVPPTAQEVAQQVKEQASKQVLETATRLQEKLGPLWQRTQGFISERQGELTGAVNRAQARAQARAQDLEVAYPTLLQSVRSTVASMQEGTEKKPAQAKTKKRTPKQPTAEGVNLAAAAETAGSASSTAPGPAAPEDKKASAVAPTVLGKIEESAPGNSTADSAAGGGQQIDAMDTMLIEAKITIADGSVLTLHVKAADRCKEVAQRFVQENSLKAWFQDPLTTWLKKVEADAVTFPVKVEGDLAEIRKQHTKAKSKA